MEKEEKRPVEDPARADWGLERLDTIVPSLQDLGRQVMPTLPSLSQEEVSTIWEHVSDFVKRQLSLYKGVHIPGLGIFTFTRQKLEVGNKKFILILRPMFIMSEKLIQIHGLKQNKVYTPGDIPIVPLNFVMISLEGPFTRDTVEGCVKETLLFLSRSISIKQNVEFTFKGIGVLVIRYGKVKMRFYKDFFCTMDGSGALAKALANRPGTVDSVLSSREAFRKQPSSAVPFPRIELKEMENKPPMETIVEEGRKNTQRKSKLKDQTDQEEGVREILSPRGLQDRQAVSSAKVTGVNLPNKFEQSGNGGKNVNPESLSSPGCLKNDNEIKPKISPATSCQGHHQAGQELCYVCVQRAQRNSPLFLSEERRRKELEDEQLTQQYQILKDKEALFKSQMRSLAIRQQNQKNAAYNLGVADAMRSHKNEKPEFYVFLKHGGGGGLRLVTCCTKSQIHKRQDGRNRMLQESFGCTGMGTMIKNKHSQLPMSEPDSLEPIFGNNWAELVEEKRKREQSYMEHQLEAAANHKRKAILRQLREQKWDLLMLQRTKEEHLAERNAELERANRMKQSLQEDWERNAAMKRQRDLEEKTFQR